MHRYPILFVFIISIAACGAANLGQPKVIPQFSTVQGSQIRAADVHIPLSFNNGESQELFVLAEGFVCPGQSIAAACQASSSCVCDYASMSSCSDLPSCCQSEDAVVWASACNSQSSPTSWLVLLPDQTANVTAPPIRTSSAPIYLRYHPSPASTCQGFGLSVLAPFDEQGPVVSIANEVVYYVSWTNAKPETDPYASILSARPGQSDNMGRPRFCPSYDSDSAQTNGFMGASNNRTAFIAMFSETTNGDMVNVEAVVSVTLFETPEVSGTTTAAPGGPLTGITAVADRATIVMPSGQLSASFSYTHTGSGCANLVVDAHANTASATTSIAADFVPVFIRWFQSGFSAASSIVLNICPDETLYFTVTTTLATSTASPGATTTLVTAFADATVARLNINDLNPNLYGPVLAGARAARMLCNASNLPSLAEGFAALLFTNDAGQYVSPCFGSYLGSNTPSCQMYPVVNRVGASHLWPAAPTGILGLRSYSLLNTATLDSVISSVVASTDLRFAVILEQVMYQSTYYGSVSGWAFRSWEELAVCTFEFGGTLVTGDGSRLSGQTEPLGRVDTNDCDPNTYDLVLKSMQATTDSFLQPAFQNLSVVDQRTSLLHQTQLALLGKWSQCTYVPQEVFLTPYVENLHCSTLDPCCALSDQNVRYFYDYCLSDVFKKIIPQMNPDAIGNDKCATALSFETTTSQVLLSSGANAINNIACSFGQDSLDLLREELRIYYSGCRTRVASSFDTGIPCTTVADCPAHTQMACLPVDLPALDNPASSRAHRRRKMCQAPTAVLDELMLECLVVFMPKLVKVKLTQEFESLGLTGTFLENLIVFVSAPGCAATGPSFLQTYSATNALVLSSSNPAGQTHNSCYNSGTCPYPVNCVDSYCELSQGCTYPWGCTTEWSSFSAPPDQQQCTSTYRCNFVTAGAASPMECSGDEATCQAACKVSLGADHFCGYCDNATGYCYVATKTNGTLLSESECASASSSTCLIQDLASLVAQPCNGLGSCDHYADVSKSKVAVTAAQCASAPGLCLTKEGSIMFPQAAGCMGATQIAGEGCTGQAAQLTDSGCLYDATVFPTRESCVNKTDPIVRTRATKGWVDLITTQADCEDNEALFVCKLNFATNVPLSGVATLNTKEVCAARKGSFESPYVWEKPTFIEGVAVPLTWITVSAVASGSWTYRTNYTEFSTVITTLVNSLQINTDVITSQCTYINALSVAALAAVCDGKNGDPQYRESCRPIWQSDNTEAPTQILGTEVVCDNTVIGDWVYYPGELSIPPAILLITPNSSLQSPPGSLMPGCANFQAAMKSNSKFSQPRRRIRESSFFIVRQDTDIPPLSTLSSTVVANGYILSDAIRVEAPGSHINQSYLCIETRSDFLDQIQAMYPNRTDWTSFYIGLGVLKDWSVTPLFSTSQVGAFLLSPEGSLYTQIFNHKFPKGSLTDLLVMCRSFDHLELEPGQTSFYVAVITYNPNPEDTPNGFSTTETVWLYITACVYLVPVLFLWLPLVLRSLLAKQEILNVPMLATFFLSMFLVFRAALLFGLAAGSIVASSVTEFALTDIAVWCEFAAVCLLGLAISAAASSSSKMKTNKGFAKSRSQQAFFLFMVVFLLAVYVAFLIAYSLTGDTSSGVTNPQTDCEGRVPAGVTEWTTRRILRLSYECLLAVMGLIIGTWLMWAGWLISRITKGSRALQLLRLTTSTIMLALMILSHAIIALILIGTQWNNFVFGITMLYVTELLPLFLFFLLSLWKNITEASLTLTRSRGTSRRSTSSPEPGTATSGSENHTRTRTEA